MWFFLLVALPFGALAGVLTLIWLSGDHHSYDDRTSGEQSFFSGQWR